MLSYPPKGLWPERIHLLPELSYADTINACNEFLDVWLAAGKGSSPAVYNRETVVTYRQLAEETMRIAGSLRQRGFRPGDPVVLRLLNRPGFIATFLAVLRIGAVAVPTSPLLRSREIAAIIESANP